MHDANCGLCGKPLDAMCMGVQGGGSFHPECFAHTYPLRVRAGIWMRHLLWRAKGSEVGDLLGTVPLYVPRHDCGIDNS